MTLAEKLTELYRIKEDIKSALEEKGFTNIGDTFATYANYIRMLPKYVLGRWAYSDTWRGGRKWNYNG